MWYWYYARENEIFLDLDSAKALTRALHVIRRAMSKAKGTYRNRLEIESLWAYPTTRPHHCHLIIVLKEKLPLQLRIEWALWMGADQIRAAYVLERLRHGFEYGETLCTERQYEFRFPDYQCLCVGKHKPKHVTDNCLALKSLLGSHRSADYFPRNRDRKQRVPLQIEWGKIPKTLIKEWR